jgi:hypothetical protein
MKFSPQATKGHLIVGALLILFSLGSMVACMLLASKFLTFLIFFFGVWGGLETGRYLESWLKTKSVQGTRK